MSLKIVRDDITNIKVDAIVNSANHTQPTKKPDGTDGAIHEAAGVEDLLKARKAIGTIEFGDAKETEAFNLSKNARYIIHTVAPIWQGGNNHEIETLRSCYQKSLALALKLNCSSIAFSVMGSGINNIPKKEALNIAVSEIINFLFGHEEVNMDVTLVLFDKETFELCKKVFPNIKERIEDRLVEQIANVEYDGNLSNRRKQQRLIAPAKPLGKTFMEYLDRLLKSKNLDFDDVRIEARVSDKICSDMRNKQNDYHPGKETAIKLALGMHLTLDETQTLLNTAYYALHANSEYDSTIIGCILKEKYKISEVNRELRSKGLQLLPIPKGK